MIPSPFEYHRPQSLDDAIGLLAAHGDDARVVAGGHSLIPMMKLRLAVPEHLIDLQDIAALRGISEQGSDLVIGAMTTQKALIDSGLLAEKCPILAETSLVIADPQVRSCGTLGGNVANGDPGNDMPAVMLALDARFMARGRNGDRAIAARSFFKGPLETALTDDEVLVAIRIPTPAAGHGAAYEKQKRKVGDYATAAAAVVLTMAGGKCTNAAIALTNVGDTPLLAEAAAAALVGTAADDAAAGEAALLAEGIAAPASDGRGPAAFRIKLAGIMVRRAIARAKARAA